MEANFVIIAYNLLLGAGVLSALWLLGRLRGRFAPATLVAFLGATLFLAGFVVASRSPLGNFGRLQLLTWLAFLHVPLFLGGAALLLRRRSRWLALACAGLAAALLLCAGDAFLVEPRWLEVSRMTLPAAGLSAPLRVVVVADIQTDAPDGYEERVLRQVAAEKADLILFAGDYLHVEDPAEFEPASAALRRALQAADLRAPLGAYAIWGNVDWSERRAEMFAGLPITVVEQTRAFDLGPLVLTALSFEDSADTELAVGRRDKYQIVLGHTPNFSRGQVAADLLLAGHTHGGQVRLPLIGPLVTLAEVPRQWAAGVTTIASGKTLIVSRGVGMERGQAPRLRFLCRPELVVVDLIPSGVDLVPK